MTGFDTGSQKKSELIEAMQTLARVGWMAQRSKRTRNLIMPLGRPRNIGADETLYRIGEMPDGIYGLIRGRVCISTPDDAGSVLDIYMGNPGFWIGDLALFARSRRLVTVTAVAPTKVWYLPQSALLELLRPHPELIADFYALNHQNTAVALRLLANLAIPDTERRLAAWLLFSDEALISADRWIDVSQQQIGTMNAVSLPSVRRALKKLETLELIELGYSKLRVRDRAALSDFCAS